MKSFAFAAVAVAALVAAEDSAADLCKSDGQTFCIASDIILRCSGPGVGQPGRCTPNLSGSFPPGGLASCYEAAKGDGKAACEKNCIVHADPVFTLPADKCTPSATQSATPSSTGTGNSTTTAQKPPASTEAEEEPCPTEWPTPNGNDTAVVPPTNAGSKNALSGAAIAGLVAAYFL
ncbi:hypothetical protein VHEMI10183 [[Torrubiella] hemipterigena]|uniref:Uncharacterized protein n=1 Tax=[Torrubiella] hemipterigena TaxID=1531966 RepID=A0A0A1TCC1_9HYPO|nr:hypothetical protein VHEMI10183 [[Torrubiella] hemipterigena]